MSKVKDITGMKFNQLTVVGLNRIERTTNNRTRALFDCVCDCGTSVTLVGTLVSRGKTKSCGCRKISAVISRNTKHSHSQRSGRTRIYSIWSGMINRCKSHKNYYGRGISVCKRWENFENFLLDMGDCPDGFSIERVDNNSGYSPENCVWADRKTQNSNTRRTRFFLHEGQMMCMKDYARATGVNYHTFASRVYKQEISNGA